MKKSIQLSLLFVWLAAAGLGMRMLLVYEYTAAAATNVPPHWPAASAIPHSVNHPTLVMFIHPKCPCSRASLGELALLMTRCQDRVSTEVVFLQPKGTDESWAHTDLWRSAEAIPSVGVRLDKDDAEADHFNVTTSGHALLYDRLGQLLFSGGITAGRGHSGDNAGRSAIQDLINHREAGVDNTPVYGCSLGNPKAKCCAKEAPL